MGNQAQRIVVREGDASDATFAHITIQPKDFRPFVLRRWSGTGIAGAWSLDDRSFGASYWRARSKEKLVDKALKKLRRNALSLGIENPVIIVNDPEALGYAGALETNGHLRDDFASGETAPGEAKYEVEVITTGAGNGAMEATPGDL